MGRVRPAQGTFLRMMQDVPRDRLPEDAVWSLVDYIPQVLGAPLAKRGGWELGHQASVWNTGAGRRQMAAVGFANLAGDKAWGIADSGGGSGALGTITNPGPSATVTTVGETRVPDENLSVYRSSLFITDALGNSDPQTYDGSTIATLTDAPAGSRSAVYKDRAVLAAETTDDGRPRVWFSEAADITDWDTTTRFIDSSAQVTALYPLQNALLIFHEGFLERIVGSIPPPGSDMSLQFVFPTGLEARSARSLAGTNEFVCFANLDGVFMTDGTSVVDLTKQGGMKSYWHEMVRGIAEAPAFSGGFHRGYYIVTARDDNNDTFADAFAISVEVGGQPPRWFRLSNVYASCFGRRTTTQEELYWGSLDLPLQLNSLSDIFFPTVSNRSDGDGTDVLPTFESRIYPVGYSKARIKYGHFHYHMPDTQGSNPMLVPSYVLSPEDTTYTEIEGSDGNTYKLAETTELTKARRFIGKTGFGIGFKLQQENASDQTFLNQIGLEGHSREMSRV